MTGTPLISAAELSQLREIGDVMIFDASWYLPVDERDTKEEYKAGHLPGAVFFDIDHISDQTTDLPHMLPDQASFEKSLRYLGLRQGQRVVVYDTAGIFSAPRAWWMLKTFGVAAVAVLNGGLPAWVAAGGKLETGQVSAAAGDVQLSLDKTQVSDLAQMKIVSASKARQIVDARAVPRFAGIVPEPRPNVEPGHIPNSINLPFGQVLSAGHLKSDEDLKSEFAAAQVDLTKPVTTTCGSGVTAAILTLALTKLTHSDLRLYDGSWAEWGSRSDTKKALVQS